jgi:hypothetical protein
MRLFSEVILVLLGICWFFLVVITILSLRQWRCQQKPYTKLNLLADWSLVLGILYLIFRELHLLHVIQLGKLPAVLLVFWPIPFVIFFMNIKHWTLAKYEPRFGRKSYYSS